MAHQGRNKVRKWTVGLSALVLLSGTAVVIPTTAVAAPPVDQPVAGAEPTSDDLPDALEAKRRENRKTALNMVMNGTAKVEQRGPSKVVKIGSTSPSAGRNSITAAVDQYVELGREKTDKIFVILTEFGNQRHPDFPDQDTHPATPGPARFDGPLRNEMPEPDRTVNNKTGWQADYNQAHYQNLYFGGGDVATTVKSYYERQSSGRYSVDGMVTDWVKVPYNEARYGRSNGYPCAGNVCSNTWFLIRDGIDTWVAGQRAKGRTDAQIAADLAAFDVWDRFDYDHDGDFNEPDGYIDHFQIVHAGGDQADADPWQGEDAIWSHRWSAFQGTTTGPDFNKRGGTQIGNTGLWVRDYTIQPENGGLSVFAHEYGHDLGLPDLYDTAGATGNAENPVNWWSIMAQSRVSLPEDQNTDGRAADFGPWEKLQLGWLDYEVVVAGQDRTLNIGPHEYNTDKPQAVVAVLPKKQIVTTLPTPPEGTKQWWSGSGDNLNNSLTRAVTLPATPATLTFKTNYDIEECGTDPCDYGYVEVDDGTGFKAIISSITTPTEGNGIDGNSRGWVDASFDLSAYAGKSIQLRFRYQTDGGTALPGFFVDSVAITAGESTVFHDGAESGPAGWTANGFSIVGASITKQFDNYYLMSNRSYVSYDQYLKSGPYNFGFLNTKPNWVEHFPYEEGLLIWYWDTSYGDNNTSQHPGNGLILPIDAHPKLMYRLDGQPWRPRIQGYDAPFGTEKADSFSLNFNSQATYIRGQAGVSLFDDSKSYYAEDLAAGVRYGVKVPKNGVKIRAVSRDGTSARVRIFK
jgi:immune inhibitor A